MSTKLVLLGTGTPKRLPERQRTCLRCGGGRPGLPGGFWTGRGAAGIQGAYYKGIDPLRPDLLTTAFCTHPHTDHTVGYADLIFTPWVLERSSPLKVFGPKGLCSV